MGSFATDSAHEKAEWRPLQVATRRESLFQEAKEMVADLAAWRLLSTDDERLVLVCERSGGLLGGSARITISVDGPEGLPSATLSVKSESSGGLFGRDRSNVSEFMRPFIRRVS
jgi:hypothetical protein